MTRVEFSGDITKCHWNLFRILQKMGFQPRNNTEFGKYKIDVTCDDLPKHGFEADGRIWHWGNRDNKRDKWLLKNCGISIIRIPEKILDGKHDEEVKEIILRSINNADN